MSNLSGQDVSIVRLEVGRGLDPRRSCRIALDEKSGLLVAGPADVAAEIIERIHAAGRAGKPIDAELADFPWKGGEVARVFVTLDPRALPPPSRATPTREPTKE